MSIVDDAKDAIDEALTLEGKRSARKVKLRMARARDIIEYIEHYIEVFNLDLYEINEEKRRDKARK